MPRAFVLLALIGCGAPQSRPTPPRGTIALTYLGVAGWSIEGDGVTILTDPYFSRPDLAAPLTPDLDAIARHAPARADLILIGHSHVDHLLDAPAVARRTGAQLVGSASSANYARAFGLPADHIITIIGGEDYAFGAASVRVIPSLHSALDHKHVDHGTIAAAPALPMTMAEFGEGGTFAYLVRLAGHEVFVLDTANFIERELVGVHPDIAILAPGLREEIHDYTCRLVHLLGDPPIVIATHFDDWHGPPIDGPPSELDAFVAEVKHCAPATRVIVPKHFDRMAL